MTAIKVQNEARRRELTNDGWYVEEAVYALEIRGAAEGSSYFVWPFGPQEMTVKRTYRQSVVATLGGIVAEEQGRFLYELHVSGNFGLYPKTGADTTPLTVVQQYDKGALPLGSQTLSGPGWTRRMLRHFFDRYADLKADPAQGHNVVLCWHNFKDDEHWIVVPVEVDLTRSSSERMLYPFTLQLRAVGDVDRLILPAEELGPMAAFLADLSDVFAAVNRGLALIQAGFQEVSAILGEVRYFIATVDTIIGNATSIAVAAGDFVAGVRDTMAAGAGFVRSTTILLEAVLATLEGVEDLPGEVRQSFQTALDGLHAIQAQYRAFGKTFRQEGAEYAEAGSATAAAEAEAARRGPATTAAAVENVAISPSDAALRAAGAYPAARRFNAYNGFIPHTIRSTDTLSSLAARYLRNGALWYEIAALNGLKSPYISLSGAPGTVRPGATIAIPYLGATPIPNVASDGGQSPEALYGTDIRVYETSDSRPGSPLVDLRVDPQTHRDVATVSGVANLTQAIQMRVWTLRGTMPLYPGYGRESLLGEKIIGSTIGAARIALRSTLIRDSRIRTVGAMRAVVTGDYIDFDVSVTPVGATEQTTISTALV